MPRTAYEETRTLFAYEGVSPDDVDAIYARFQASGSNNFADWLHRVTSRAEPRSFWLRFADSAVDAYAGRSLKQFILFHLQLGGLLFAALVVTLVGVTIWGAASDYMEPEPTQTPPVQAPPADAAAAPTGWSIERID